MSFFNIFNKDIYGSNFSTLIVSIEKNFNVLLIKFFAPIYKKEKEKRKKKWIFIINKQKKKKVGNEHYLKWLMVNAQVPHKNNSFPP